jgi:hypothetical protein
MEAPVLDHPVAARSRGPARLWACGIGIALICIAFAARYPLRGHAEELVDIGKLADYGTVPFIGYVLGMVAMAALYIAALRESRRIDPNQAIRVIWVCGAAQVAAMAWMYPVNAIDIFIYSVRSRLLTEYAANPNAAFPKDFSGDAFMRFASAEWADDVSPYGPLWNTIAAPITAISDDRIAVALAGFKILAAAAALGGTWLIMQFVRVTRPDDAPFAGMLYLWNPLVLWEGVGNGHNDLVVMLPIFGAFVAWVIKRDALVIPLLVTAALIKYTPALMIPLAALALWQRSRSWRERLALAGWSALGSLLVIGIGLSPFYDLDALRESVSRQSSIFLPSPVSLALNLLHERFEGQDWQIWVKRAGYCSVALALLWQARRLIRHPGWLPRATYEVTFVYLLIAAWGFRNWYLIWIIGLAALLAPGWPAARAMAWTFGAVAVYGVYIWIWHWWGADFLTIQKISVPLTFGPAAILTAAELAIAAWRRWLGAPRLVSSAPSGYQ